MSDRGPQELAVNLATDHQGLTQVGHSDLKAKGAFFRADNCLVGEVYGLGSILGKSDFGHNHAAPEAVDYDADKTLNYDQSHGSGTDVSDVHVSVSDGGLGLQREEEGVSQAVDAVGARRVIRRWILPL